MKKPFFSAKEDHLRYEEYKVSLMHKCSRVVAGLGSALFPLYYFIDIYVHRYALRELTILRAITTVIFLAFFFYLRKRQFSGNPRKLIFGLLIFAAFSITGMCMLTGGYVSPVYAGVNLVLLTAALTYPVGGLGMGGLVLSILGIYYLSVLTQAGFKITDTATFINNSYFLASTGIITIAAAVMAEYLRQESFSRFLQVEKAETDLKHQHEIKSRFFANVTHELRTPLTLILGPLEEMLANDSISEQQKSGIEMAKRNAEILLKHVGDLLDVSKLESSNVPVKYRKVNLSHLSSRIASQFEHFATEKNIQYTQNIAGEIHAEVDTEKFERIFTNILSNAFKFTPASGAIVCDVKVEHQNIHVSVSDSGPGIPRHLRESIFERFFQVEESNTRKFEGTGLGLAIVKEFAELHKGKAWADDSKLGGVSLHFTLPLKAPAGAEVITASELQLRVPPPVRKQLLAGEDKIMCLHPEESGLPLVLVVEDNADMRSYIRSVLCKEYRILEAKNGREGWETAMAFPPDLILTDIMMPEFSGIDLLNEVRRNQAIASIPILFLTARADEKLNLNLLSMGAQDYILKPFSSEELLARVRNWVTIKRSKDILQKELQSSNESVEGLAKDVASALSQAQSALKLREEFITLASHALNTPLTALKLESQMASKRFYQGLVDPGAYKKFLDSNDFHLNRLIQIVSDMLIVAQLKSTGLELHKISLDLDQLVGQIIANHKSDYESFVSSLIIKSSGPIIGKWDPERIEQVILNLLNNAVKFGKGLPIEISLGQDKGQVTIDIKDSGIGIELSEQEKIFAEFGRGVTTNEYTGLGLGLFITKQIVDAHGGHIEVQSDVDEGSLFRVTLPLES